MMGHPNWGAMKSWVTCKQKRRAQPAIHATLIKIKASPETSKQRVVAMMYRVSYRDDQRGVAIIEICKERLRYVVQRMEGLELRLEGAIYIVDRLFGIDLEQIAEAKMRLDIEFIVFASVLTASSIIALLCKGLSRCRRPKGRKRYEIRSKLSRPS